MSSPPSSAQAQSILERARYALKLTHLTHTNPTLMRAIIVELHLDDFHTEHAVMSQVLHDMVTTPQPLQPMFDTIAQGMIAKHPALVEFLNVALDHKWLAASPHVVKAAHHAYLLETLTSAMCNSHAFFIEMHNHYRNKRKAKGIDCLHTFRTFLQGYRIGHSVFGILKAILVDPAMQYFRLQRGLTHSRIPESEVRRMQETGRINWIEKRLLSPLGRKGLEHANELIRINIYEAGIAEFKNGFASNAVAAHVLAEDILGHPPLTDFVRTPVLPRHPFDPLYGTITERPNLFPVFSFSQDWVSLYIAWNLTFALNSCEDLDLIIPKLLIPSVIDCAPEHFMGTRVISLWLTLHFVFFRRYEKRIVRGPADKAALAKEWAMINKRVAFDLAKREVHEDELRVLSGFRAFFAHPIFHFLKILWSL